MCTFLKMPVLGLILSFGSSPLKGSILTGEDVFLGCLGESEEASPTLASDILGVYSLSPILKS